MFGMCKILDIYFISVSTNSQTLQSTTLFCKRTFVGPLIPQDEKLRVFELVDTIEILWLPTDRALYQYTCPKDKHYVYISICSQDTVGKMNM